MPVSVSVSDVPAHAVSDHVALAEIELCGEVMIAAASAEGEERLSADRIDEVLRVRKPLHELPAQRGPADDAPPEARRV